MPHRSGHVGKHGIISLFQTLSKSISLRSNFNFGRIMSKGGRTGFRLPTRGRFL